MKKVLVINVEKYKNLKDNMIYHKNNIGNNNKTFMKYLFQTPTTVENIILSQVYIRFPLAFIIIKIST